MACYIEALLCNKGEMCLENAAKKSLKLFFYEFIQWKMDMLSLPQIRLLQTEHIELFCLNCKNCTQMKM